MVTFDLLKGEYWWGGTVDVGAAAPLGDGQLSRDLADPGRLPSGEPYPSSQSAPILLSTRGRAITSQQPFSYHFDDKTLALSSPAVSSAGTGNLRAAKPASLGTEGPGAANSTRVQADNAPSAEEPVILRQLGSNLAGAYRGVMGEFFPPSGQMPALEMFAHPQYNTWIEMPYTPSQAQVIQYADSILAASLPPGVLFIDDNWAPDYGEWVFDKSRFPDPKRMLDYLHKKGFSVMLWVVPFISPDSAQFRYLERAGYLLRDGSGQVAIRRWWNGYSALLDITDPQAAQWLRTRLDALQELGVDGFKFDAGDVGFYRPDDRSYAGCSPVQHCQAWAKFGLFTPFNEYRACWKMGGQALGQRLRDKPAQWGAAGIESLIPEVLGQAMIGHFYTCPDMIGGGEISSCQSLSAVDQEFVLRYAQVAALMPMMQFSMNPARILDQHHLSLLWEVLKVRARFVPRILELAKLAAETGDPIVRPVAFHCADQQAGAINDQFFLGPDLLVAPQVKPGGSSRRVFLPAGSWLSDRGEVIRVLKAGTTSTYTQLPEGECASLPDLQASTWEIAQGLSGLRSSKVGGDASSPTKMVFAENAVSGVGAGCVAEANPDVKASHVDQFGGWVEVSTPLGRLPFFERQG